MTGALYLDTNFLITTFEVVEMQASHGWSVLQGLEAGLFTAVTSELTLAELLPKPLARGDTELVDTYCKLLTDKPGFSVVPISRDILVHAAEARSRDRSLKLLDAIHLATALRCACKAFLTDDLRLNLPKSLDRVRLNASTLDDIGRILK